MPRLGKYELLSRIAQGGQAETFRAQLEGAAGVTKQVVIKKVLPAYAQDEAFIAAFIGEAQLSAGLSHGNIAQVFEFGQVDGDYFLAMEWVDGKSLAEALTRSKELGAAALPVPLACFLAIEVCKALHYAHGKGIVHRDVSPDNILIGYEGQTKVIDFGIAKAAQVGRRETEPGLVKGKFLYFSPEQAHARPLDGRSDVFALGIVLYRMLSGVLPFAGQMHEVVHAIQHARFKPIGAVVPDLSPALTAVVMKALAKAPADRFASALELQQALTAVLYAEDAAFSSETLRDWMAWLFTGQKTPRLDRQLKTWAGAAVQAPVKTEPAAPVTRPPGGVPWLALGVAAGALAVGAVAFSELRSAEPEPAAPALLKPAPDVAQKPVAAAAPKPAAVRDAMVYPGTAVIRADRHRIRFQGLPLPMAELKPGALTVVEKKASGDDSPLFLKLSGGETVLALQQPTALPAGTSSARAFDLRPFGEPPRGANRTLDFSGQALTFLDGAAAVDARNAAWFSVAGVPADKRVRLTLRALEPEQWKARPRPASVVVVWKRAFGRLPPPAGSVWPDEVDRAVLTADRPLVIEHATELVMTFADELARDEKDSVLVELFDTGEPASRPDPAALAKVTSALLEKSAPAPTSKRRPAQKTVEVGGAGADQLFDEALTFFERGQHAQARPKLEQCIVVAPKDFECHKLLGSVLTQLGETRRAVAAFREFVRLAPPGDPDVPRVKALIQLAEGHP